MEVQAQRENKVKYTNTTAKSIILNNTEMKGIEQQEDESDFDFRQRIIKHQSENFIENCKELR